MICLKKSNRQPYQVKYHEYINKLSTIDVEHKILNESVYMHWHEFCELEFVVHGTGTHKFNNQIIPFCKGSLYLQLATDFHEVLIDKDCIPELYSIKFSEAFIEPAIYQTIFNSKRQRQVTLAGEEYEKVLNDFKQIEEEFQKQEIFHEHVLKSLVEKVIIELERKAEEVKPIGKSDIENRLQRCLSFIQKNYYRTILLEEIANNANMSPNYFSAYFRKSVGCTFREYLKNLRMRFSISFLTNFETPIFQIGEMVGYNSYEQFERTFKHEFGISPSTFRDTLHKQRKNALNVLKTNVEFNGIQLLIGKTAG